MYQYQYVRVCFSTNSTNRLPNTCTFFGWSRAGECPVYWSTSATTVTSWASSLAPPAPTTTTLPSSRAGPVVIETLRPVGRPVEKWKGASLHRMWVPVYLLKHCRKAFNSVICPSICVCRHLADVFLQRENLRYSTCILKSSMGLGHLHVPICRL